MPASGDLFGMGSFLDETQALHQSAPRSDVPPMTLTSPKSVVEVYAHQARNMPSVAGASQADYYAVLEVTGSRQLYNSHVAQDTLHPVWNESFQVKCTNDEQMITVSLFAERHGKDDLFVGVVVVPVKRVKLGGGGEEGGWYEVRFDDNEMVQSADGISKVELTFVYRDATPGLQPRMGWLTKRDNASQQWHRMFFILDPYNQMLRFFNTPEDAQNAAPKIIGEMNVRCCDVVEGIGKIGGGVTNPSSELSPHDHIADGQFFKATTNWMTLVAFADTLQETTRWAHSLREAGNTPDIRHLPPPPTLNPMRGTHYTQPSNKPPPPSPPAPAVQPPSRKGLQGVEQSSVPVPQSRQSLQGKRSSHQGTSHLPSQPKESDSLGRILSMLAKPRSSSPPPPASLHATQEYASPRGDRDGRRRSNADHNLENSEIRLYADGAAEAEALAIKYEAARKALTDSMAKNREYEQHIKRMETAGSSKAPAPSSALLEHTRRQLGEAEAQVDKLQQQVEEFKRAGMQEGAAMEEAIQASNMQLKKSSEELVMLRTANRKLSEDKAKLIADNTELATRFDAARQALARHVQLDRGFGKGFVGEKKDQTSTDRKLREVEQRAMVAAEGFQASMGAMEEEKLELIEEIKRLQGQLQKMTDVDKHDSAGKDEADRRMAERFSEMQSMLDLDRQAFGEEKAALEKERRHLLILKGQLDRQQAALAARIKDVAGASGKRSTASPLPAAHDARAASSAPTSPIVESTASPEAHNVSKSLGYSAYLSPSSPKERRLDGYSSYSEEAA